jgi:acyl-CoA thioesterase-2
MTLLQTSLRPHGQSLFDPKLQIASLDHAMWFHRPFRTDDWLLYAQDSPSSSQSRGFNRGNIFTRDGLLVASVCQEGLMRVRD